MKTWNYRLVYLRRAGLVCGELQGKVAAGVIEAENEEQAYSAASRLTTLPDADHVFSNWYVWPVGESFVYKPTWKDMELEAVAQETAGLV